MEMFMSIDENTAARVAQLARIKVEPEALPALAEEFNNILGFIEQLSEVDVDGIEPMTSVMWSPMATSRTACWPMPPMPVKGSLPCRRWWNNDRSEQTEPCRSPRCPAQG